jgi:regulator of sigma E protease
MEIIFIVLFILSLFILILLHEFGHFILAKKFGVKVEEFGIGYPPRLFGKKIGETLFSINLLPLGGFVKIHGEEEKSDDPRSFGQKPLWQRALIVFGGSISFWLISIIILSIVMNMGAPQMVDDEMQDLQNPQVQIVAVASESPAGEAGLRAGDVISKLRLNDNVISVDRVKEVQEFTQENKGKEVTLIIKRGKEILEMVLIPRVSPPENEGPMGIALARIVIESYPWQEAIKKGISGTVNLTVLIVKGWGQALGNFVLGVPTGVQIMGPIGTTKKAAEIGQLGITYFLQFVAMVAVYVGMFNLLPIPALDGGKLLFLGIEKIKGKPIPQKLEQRINTFFFILLVALIILVSIREVIASF